MIISVLAAITGVMMPLGYYFQAWKIIKTKSATDISLPFLIIFSVGSATWLVYGWYLRDVVVISSFALGVIGSWTTLFLSLRYKKAKK